MVVRRRANTRVPRLVDCGGSLLDEAHMDVQIGQVPRREIGRASEVLTRAFAADGILSHYLSGPWQRFATRAFFSSVIHEHLPTTYAATVGSTLVGVAAWSAPSEPPAPLGRRIRARGRLMQVRVLFPRSSRPLWNGLQQMAQLRPAEPHWYLAFTGVEPAWQGHRIGETLLRPVLSLADADGIPCYLETPFPETHQFYRRLGFEITSELHPFPDAPLLWALIRMPQRARGR
jgi:GNAT superfamily N-acetyltransferase